MVFQNNMSGLSIKYEYRLHPSINHSTWYHLESAGKEEEIKMPIYSVSLFPFW
jgi:hypothetical protein